MDKIMSLDVGTKRIGVAISDFLHIIAIGNCVVQRNPEEEAIEKIKKIASENNIKTIVVGVPLNMDGSEGAQANDCIWFANNLKKYFELVFEDERLTSMQAEENLKARKIDFRKHKELVDIESACIILEQYLSRVKK